MEHRDFEAEAVNLTIRDRINYPYILANQILTVQRTMLTGESTQILDSIEALIHQIPVEYHDESYMADLAKGISNVKTDIRPEFAGVKLSREFCEERGYPTEKEETIRDPWLSLQAVFNLLQRRGMLTRRSYTEIQLGLTWEAFQESQKDVEE